MRTSTRQAQERSAPARIQRSPDEARSFANVSIASIAQVVQAQEERRALGIHTACSCSPYEDVFTFNRWRDQGLIVNRGEKSLQIASWVERGGKSKDLPADIPETDRAKLGEVRLRPQKVCLFCRCQVSSKFANESTNAPV